VLDVTVDEDATGVFAAPASVSSDVEILLRNLVGKLEKASATHGDTCEHFSDEGHVLLDVEVDGVRLLALRQESPSPISLLSPREQEIARMVATGYPNKTIASVLEISSWTVASHLRRIFMKLQVSSRAAMVTRLSSSVLSEMFPSNIERHEQLFPLESSPRRIET
jgi:DNA-binding CsgD family transcriptional regulator